MLWLSHRAEIGGAELALAEGVTALARRGHEVHVVLPQEGGLRDHLTDASGVHVCHHNVWMTSRPTMWRTARWLTYNACVAAPAINRIARRLDADVVISNTITLAVEGIAIDRPRPHVWFLHEFGDLDHGLRFLLGEPVTTYLMRRAGDMFIVNSAAMREHFATRFPARKLRRVNYAVEIPQGVRSPVAALSPYRLILVGRRTPSKGQHDAVEGIDILRHRGLDVKLDLVGDGEPAYEEELRKVIRQKGLDSHVRLFPFTDRPLRLMSEAHVVLMCSRSEALGRVTIEAMKHGKPVIGAAAGATPQLIRHGWNGFLYRPGDPEDLAGWIQTLHRFPETATLMGKRGRAWALEEFNLERYGAQLEDVLEEARLSLGA